MDKVQILGRLEGEGMMYLRGRLGDSILDLGEAHQADDGFWSFAESYDEYPKFVIMSILSFLYRVNHTELVIS